MFLKRKMNDSTNSYSDKILQIKEKIEEADAIIIGAGAGFANAVECRLKMMILSDTITMVPSTRTIVSGVMPMEHILTMIWTI